MNDRDYAIHNLYVSVFMHAYQNGRNVEDATREAKAAVEAYRAMFPAAPVQLTGSISVI